MAISIDWGTSVIFVPKDYTELIQTLPNEVRRLDIDKFRLDLKALEATDFGMAALRTHTHNTIVNIGGITLARVVEVINDYTITFEDGNYAVDMYGANSNLMDRTNFNDVAVRANNSAGLVEVNSGVSVTPEDVQNITDSVLGSDLNPYVGMNDTLGNSAYHLKHLNYTIFINTNKPTDGDGSQHYPFNNETSAIDYAETHGIYNFILYSELSLTRQLKNFTVSGVGTPKILFNGEDLRGSEFDHCELTGSYLNNIVAQECRLLGAMDLNGYFETCAISGDFTIPDGGTAYLTNCSPLVIGDIKPTFDIGGLTGTANLINMDFTGGATIINCTQPTDDVKMVIQGGVVEIDSSCVDGTIRLFGNGILIDNSTMGDKIINNMIDPDIESTVWDANQTDHEISKTMGDGVNHIKFLEHFIYLDTDNPVNGDGSQHNPFNVVNDAIDLAEFHNIRRIFVYSDVEIHRQLRNFTIYGVGRPVVEFFGDSMEGSIFKECALRGTYTGSIVADHCRLDDGLLLNGAFVDCGLNGDLMCADGASVVLVNGASVIAGLGRPTISMNPVGTATLSLRSNRGGMTIYDCNHPLDRVTVGVAEGSLTFDASCTDGEMVARGSCVFKDETPTNVDNVTDETFSPYDVRDIADQVWNKDKDYSFVSNSMGEFMTKKLLTLKSYLGLQ